MSTPEKKPSRRGRVVRAASNQPASFESGAPAVPSTPGQFEPAAWAKQLDLWRLNRAKGAWLIRPNGGECLEVNTADLRLLSREQGIAAGKPESGLSDFEKLRSEVIKTRSVDCVVDKLAGWRGGFHLFNGSRIYVKRGPLLIASRAGSWETIRALVEGVLRDNAPVFYGWLKIAVEALRDGAIRPGQLLIIIGPRACGKSRIQHWIVTPLLGGESEDPSSYMIGDTDFNEELFGVVHLLMEDPALRDDAEAKTRFAARMKELTVNDKRRLHPKGSKALSLAPLWRPTLSLNDDETSVLPFVSDSLEDKLIVLRAHAYDPPIGSGSNEERSAWETHIREELPAFLAWLFAYEIPAELRCKRFGVRHFIDPAIAADLHEQSPDARVLECIDAELWHEAHGGPRVWEGNPTELSNVLQHPSSQVSREARSVFRGPSQLGRVLTRLVKSQPDRVRFSRRGSKRTYRVVPEGWRENGKSPSESA